MGEYDYLPNELCKLGLKKKEAQVYLILLESGYSSIQKIAEKTALSRPTVYRILESLQKRELISKDKKGKRSYFLAGSPDSLLKILKVQKRKVEEQEREFLRIISVLQGKYHLLSSKNDIKDHKSAKGKKLALEELANSNAENIDALLASDEKCAKQITDTIKKIKNRIGSRLQARILLKEDIDLKTPGLALETSGSLPAAGKNIVIGKKVYLFQKDKVLIIEQPDTVEFFRLMFETIWKTSKTD